MNLPIKKMEDNFSEKLFSLNPKEVFVIDKIENFNWQPNLENHFIKTDTINKNLAKCLKQTIKTK